LHAPSLPPCIFDVFSVVIWAVCMV
jgi:hypothetical protein